MKKEPGKERASRKMAAPQRVGGGPGGGAHACNAVIKSPEDKRQYQYIRLRNGMTCLAVHDPDMTTPVSILNERSVCHEICLGPDAFVRCEKTLI